MATTRYVWGKYNVSQNISGYNKFYLNSSGQLNVEIGGFKTGTSITIGNLAYTASNGVKFYSAMLSGTIKSITTGNNASGWDGFITASIPSGVYYQSGTSGLVASTTSGSTLDEAFNLLYEEEDVYLSSEDMMLYSDSAITFFMPNDDEEGGYCQTHGTMYFVSGSGSKGSLVSYVSSNSSDTYPEDGTSGSYYYSYLCCNYFDPTAVALTANPVAGASATIKVTPRSNSYGTVSYLYQYSTNGGSSYTTIATSSATSYSFSVPSGATSIKVRVRAQDNIGFTSSTYVESSTYTVNQYTSYAGASGVVKGIKPVVCVSGAIKTSVTTKKGVSGVVK